MGDPVRVLILAGSLRAGSLSKKLARHASNVLLQLGAQVDWLDLKDVPMPPYDGDIESSEGLPAGAVEFKRRLAAAEGMWITSPEYNHSIPGTFKNAIDWATRGTDDVFSGKVAALSAISPGLAGGMRMLPHLRQVLTALGVWLLPGQVTVSKADTAFDEQGKLIVSSFDKQVETLSRTLIDEIIRHR